MLPELLLILFITTGLRLKIMFLVLNLLLAKKQRLGEHINGKNQTKNRTHYFYNDQIDLKDVDATLLKIDKKRLQRH